MKNEVFYFSGTGNSFAIAKDIAAKLLDAEIREIKQDMEFHQDAQIDTLGIVYPVYDWGPPKIVADFLKKLSVPQSTYVYCVANYGGLLGSSNLVVKEMLQERGIQLSAGFAIQMPGNFIPMYNIANDKRIAKLFSAKDAKVLKIADAVHAKQKAKIETSLGFLGKHLSTKVYSAAMAHINEFGKKFTVDGTCNGCGLCMRICPKKNIVMHAGKPEWQNDCEACLACMHWCPNKAIQYGEKTAGRKRYHNQSVTSAEMIKR